MVAGFLSWVAAVAEAYHAVSSGWLWPFGAAIALAFVVASAARFPAAKDRGEVLFRVFFGVVAAGMFASAMHSPRAYGVYSATAAGAAVAIGLLLGMVGVGSMLGDRSAARRRAKAR